MIGRVRRKRRPFNHPLTASLGAGLLILFKASIKHFADNQSLNFDRTKISEDVKHTFAWTIERFSERQEPNSQFLWSSKFTIRGPDEQVS